MVRIDKEAAETLLKGKTPREIYDLIREQVSKAPDAKISDLTDTLEWVIEQGYATEEQLDAVEEENGQTA